MKMRIFLVGTVLILAMAMSAAGADVTGKWVAEQQSRQGETQQIVFNFKVNGETLTGTMSGGQGGDSEISDGKVEGDDISFAVVRAMGEMEMRTLYRGKVSGDEIRFTVERQGGGQGGGMGRQGGGGQGGGMGGPGSGGQGGGIGKPGGGGQQELVAKRSQ